MMQEKVWQPKDIIYAKDVMMFKNPETKEIEFWISGKNGFCKIESLDAHCHIVKKLPENLHFLERNLEQELYDNKSFKSYKGYYTEKDFDMMYLISKIRRLEFALTMQNLNKENFAQFVKYMKPKWHPAKPTFFALGKRDMTLSLAKMDKGVHTLTKNMFFDCITCLQYNYNTKRLELKYLEAQHYMTHIRSWKFFKNCIPRIQNRNRFFTYYELILYKEFLNMNYGKKLQGLIAYKRNLEDKIESNKIAKAQKIKDDQRKENSKDLYEF
ncbi:MAG: hypothetical protein J6A98_03560 [Clostridia bacterium]|nr:hypothetical protein [Clostridia bacterium]